MIELARDDALVSVEQIDPDLGWPRRSGICEVTGQPKDIRDVHTLRVRCQIADLHVLNHATAKQAHGQLLARRTAPHGAGYRLAVELSDQGEVRSVATNETSEIEEL